MQRTIRDHLLTIFIIPEGAAWGMSATTQAMTSAGSLPVPSGTLSSATLLLFVLLRQNLTR